MTFSEYVVNGQKIIDDLRSQELPIILYGCGSIGNFVFGVLKHYGIEPACYLTASGANTQLSDSNTTFNGIKVYTIEDFPFEPKSYKMLLTLDSRHFETIIPLCDKMGFSDMVPFSLDLQNSVLALYYKDFFNAHKVCMESKFLQVKDGIFIKNPELLPEVDLKTYLQEWNDLLLGDIYREFSLLTEGPYVYDKVSVNKGDVVFDCGANLGVFSSFAVGKGAKVYSFEPDERLCGLLKDYEIVYGENRLIPCRFALSNKTGTVNFVYSEVGNVSGSYVDNDNGHFNTSSNARIEEIPAITIDDFVASNAITSVDYIKADIEGAERHMLAGAKEILAKFSPKLAICTYHLNDDPKVLEDIIRKANPQYNIIHKWKKLYAWV